ncbi:molybdenum cofactor biosynthesis protein A [Oceaniovalibus guishaninsula JLT2003]|uniref:Molybdopterin molybdenumtransferase n=1 Tax=Oceaniovalibus guishaninsula JLT2003 TaxID=1231392 RepID=K2H7T4_9RHOB|nr:gephyrin-like molybdotransferase Glp [Oceaniovalibus guishaninsula]EKE43678.1 molybdenum cofactor biosynthesis protein A [Oceaniovalibus guishaninsula JLT2003]
MISVTEALERLFALVDPLDSETVPLRQARNRVMSRPVAAFRDQPPFAASAMDGYAIADDAAPGASFRVIGESAAGARFQGRVGLGEAVRIFTGAPLPTGADRVVIQENAVRDGQTVTFTERAEPGRNIRPSGGDFHKDDTHFPRRALNPADIALLAAMGAGAVPVTRKPQVALIATGDELVAPGEAAGPDQIFASNTYGLAAMFEASGCIANMVPIARDDAASMNGAFDLARGADLVVTVGGASVGDHDLVAGIAAQRGMVPAFHKVAMRPGKPLMAGRIDGAPMIGLPGNPVSAMICGILFVLPVLRVLQGLPAGPAPRFNARLATEIDANGDREHYMRATNGADGIQPFDRQDSSLLRILSDADALLVRPPHDPPRGIGETVECIAIA